MSDRILEILLKIFLTYAAVSMLGGFAIFFLQVSDLFHMRSTGPFMILWMGPMMIGVSLGVPLALFQLWKKR